MTKKTFPEELAYLCGILSLALGCACMERADFGLSMVVAPAYLLYRKLSESFSFLSFGMMEYIFQAFLLLLMVLAIRRFRISYLFSFVTAVIYGYTLNGMMALVGLLPYGGIPLRCGLYLAGLVLCSAGVAFMLHTYIPAEVYELIVKEVPARFHLDLVRFKTAYDIASCLLGIVLSFCFFGMWHFEGVKLGTVLCALINGFLIGRFSARMEKHWQFRPLLPLRRLCEK